MTDWKRVVAMATCSSPAQSMGLDFGDRGIFWSPDESTLVVFVVLCLRRKEPKMNKKSTFFSRGFKCVSMSYFFTGTFSPTLSFFCGSDTFIVFLYHNLLA